MGFCVNDKNWWTNYGWTCDQTSARFSNSYWSGSSGTASQTTKSKGTPSFKSNAKDTATNMAHANPATGNPVKTENYYQLIKWGNTYQDKWPDLGTALTEKGQFYEGEG